MIRSTKKNEFDMLYKFYEDEKEIGYLEFRKLYETLDILNIFVDEAHRRKKIATSLLKKCFDDNLDVTKIMLEVNENNEIAIKLYSSLGFKEISKRRNYYGNETAIIMERSENL